MKKNNLYLAVFVIVSVFSSIIFARNFIIYNTSAPSQIYFAVNGSTGYVGIGLPNPSMPLEVVGVAKIDDLIIDNKPSCQVLATDSSGNVVCGSISSGETDPLWSSNISSLSNNYVPKKSGSSLVDSSIYVDSLGNVGIGTTSPQEKLDVVGGYIKGTLAFWDNTPQRRWIITPWGTNNNNLAFRSVVTNEHYMVFDPSTYYGGTGAGIKIFKDFAVAGAGGSINDPSIYVDQSAGNVGIGTTSPQAKLDVAGTAEVDDLKIDNKASCGKLYTDSSGNVLCGTDQQGVTGSGTSNYIPKWTGSTTLGNSVIYESGGNIGVGKTSPNDRLDVSGNIDSTTAYQLNDKDLCRWGYSASISTAGWYRIAQNSGNRANAIFTLRDYISGGGHSTLRFHAGISYNYANGIDFTVISHSYFSTPTFTKVRILENSTYDTQYLEVYVARTGSMDFTICDNMQSSGWTPVNWQAGNVPSGYTVHEYDVNNLFVVGASDDVFTIARSGNVGIGTTSPSSKLEVNGNVELTNLLDNDGTNFFDGSCTYGVASISSDGTLNCASNPDTNYGQWYALDDDGDQYAITSSNKLRFTSSSGSIATNLINGDDLDENIDINVVFGSTAGRAAEGNKQITVSAGSGLAGGGTVTIGAGGTITLSHADTSSQSSVNNAGGVVIQDVTLDGFGHVTGLTSVNLDSRYLQSESDPLYNSNVTALTNNYLIKKTSSGLTNSIVYDDGSHLGIGTSSPGNYKIYAVHTQNSDAFYFKGYSSTTGEHDVFTIEEPDVGGGGQDESSVLKVIRTGSFNANDDASTLVELTYTGSTASNDRQFYIVGRRVNEGQVLWGVDMYDSDIWTTGGIKAGASGIDCGGSGSACFSNPKFSFDSSSNSFTVQADSRMTGDVIIEI